MRWRTALACRCYRSPPQGSNARRRATSLRAYLRVSDGLLPQGAHGDLPPPSCFAILMADATVTRRRREMPEQDPGRFFERVREKSELLIRRSISNPTADPVVGNSARPKIGKAIVEATITASPQPLSSAGFDLVGSLVGIEDEQSALLRSIDRSRAPAFRPVPHRSPPGAGGCEGPP
jgi:hypothetical protein